jgi:hypothetical protein
MPLTFQRGFSFQRGRRILNWLKSNPGIVIIFSDEKLFYVDAAHNPRNDKYLSSETVECISENVKFTKKSKNPAHVMVLGLVGSDGQVCPPILIPQGIKVNTQAYLELLQKKALPWLKAKYPEGNYCFQQDGAPAHTALKTQEYLQNRGAFD